MRWRTTVINNCFDTFNKLLQDPQLFIDRKIGVLVHENGKFDRDYVVNDMFDSYLDYVNHLPQMLEKHYGFKITGLEDYNDAIKERCSWLSEIWNQPSITAHGYLGFSKGSSFDWHTDDSNVYLHVIKGTKTVNLDHKSVVLNDDQGIFINQGDSHKIDNNTDNIAISFGHL